MYPRGKSRVKQPNYKLGKDAKSRHEFKKKKKSVYECTLNGNSLIVVRSSAGCLAH